MNTNANTSGESQQKTRLGLSWCFYYSASLEDMAIFSPHLLPAAPQERFCALEVVQIGKTIRRPSQLKILAVFAGVYTHAQLAKSFFYGLANLAELKILYSGRDKLNPFFRQNVIPYAASIH